MTSVSGTQLLLAMLVMFAAASIQGSVGFGQNLLAAPILFQIDEMLVPAPIMVAATVTNLSMYVRERNNVDLALAGPAIIGRLPGAIIGAFVVAAVSAQVLSIIVALAVFAVVLLSAFGGTPAPSRPLLGGAGLVSGFTGTTTSIGGPFVALAMSSAPGPTLRSSMGLYFIAGSVTTLTMLAIAGVLDGQALKAGLLLMPAVLGGFYCSRWFIPFLDRGYTRHAVLALSSLAAVLLVVRIGLA